MYTHKIFASLFLASYLALTQTADAGTVQKITDASGRFHTFRDVTNKALKQGYVCQLTSNISVMTAYEYAPMNLVKRQAPQTHIVFESRAGVLEVIDSNSNEIFEDTLDRVIIQEKGKAAFDIQDAAEKKKMFDGAYAIVRSYFILDKVSTPETQNNYKKGDNSSSKRHIAQK